LTDLTDVNDMPLDDLVTLGEILSGHRVPLAPTPVLPARKARPMGTSSSPAAMSKA
jgi:hypothetical protein